MSLFDAFSATLSAPRRLLRAAMPVTPPPPPPNLRSSLALRLTRLSPLLLLAAALVALAVFFMPGGQPAQAQASVWSATLTEPAVAGIDGCSNALGGARACTLTSVLSDDDFTYEGVDYTVITMGVANGTLSWRLDKAIPAAIRSRGTLNVDGTAFSFGDASLANNDNTANWSNSGLSWSAGDMVSLSVTVASTTPTPDADGVTTYWSETLTTAEVQYGFGCGFRTGQPQCSAQLSDDDFMYHGTDYTIELVHVAYGETLQLILSGVPRAPNDGDGSGPERSRMALNVGSQQFLVKDAMISYGALNKPNAWVLTWTGSGLSWSENARISLRLVTLPAGGL